MEIVAKLKNKFNVNNPILIDEIRSLCGEISKVRVAQLLQDAVKRGDLARFESGIYYVPTQTVLGSSLLSVNKVIEKKYIQNGGDVYGFYCGLSFMNSLGLSTQVPNTFEIMTNNESTRVRKVSVSNQEIVLRKARVKINASNYKALQFLELITTTKISVLLSNKAKLKKYFNENMDKKQIRQYVADFPAKTIKNLFALELM